LAPEVWVGTPLRRAADARQRLEGHIEQIIPVVADTAGATITDLRPIVPDIEKLAASIKTHRRALLTLYALFVAVLGKQDRSAALDALVDRYMAEIGAPSSEALVARKLFGTLDVWPVEVHQESLDRYFASRSIPWGSTPQKCSTLCSASRLPSAIVARSSSKRQGHAWRARSKPIPAILPSAFWKSRSLQESGSTGRPPCCRGWASAGHTGTHL